MLSNKQHMIEQVKTIYNYLYTEKILYDRKTIRSMDYIDMTNLDMEEYDEYIQSDDYGKSFFDLLPPFESGVIRYTTNTNQTYLYFKINEIDLNEKIYNFSLQEYRSDMDSEIPWENTFCTNCAIKYSDSVKVYYEGHLKDIMELCQNEDGVNILRAIWSDKNERKFYKEHTEKAIIHSANNFYDKELHNRYYDNYIEYIKRNTDSSLSTYALSNVVLFKELMKICNYKLKKNKPSTIRTSGSSVKSVIEKNTEIPKKQKIRAFGDVKIKSVKVPKTPTEESIRHYKIASWNKRGHVRHYKSGKEVYIKQTVCKRKGFDDNVKPLQTVIDVKTIKKGDK